MTSEQREKLKCEYCGHGQMEYESGFWACDDCHKVISDSTMTVIQHRIEERDSLHAELKEMARAVVELNDMVNSYMPKYSFSVNDDWMRAYDLAAKARAILEGD